ncbi:hypothetical protein BC938DRAFT_483296 [Jimgerdemannia flammicorona]|uniref:Uncharacterized protein n=1 Tax=Jimgerdemannia flammicorona TaxID=994334 RepID=A0A433QVR0_9FUNG|nr:hypothetical protein BC938DRAFT_483296 [Jimgerdemannia flammicorona]
MFPPYVEKLRTTSDCTSTTFATNGTARPSDLDKDEDVIDMPEKDTEQLKAIDSDSEKSSDEHVENNDDSERQMSPSDHEHFSQAYATRDFQAFGVPTRCYGYKLQLARQFRS